MTAAADPPAPRRAPQPADQPALRSVPQPAPGPVPQPAPGPAPQPALQPSGAMPSVLAGLGVLARADWAGQPSVTLGGMLVDLERAESVLVAARSRVLAAFTAQRGFEDDGQGSARSWLTWQSRVTRPAASAAVSWARRLGEHPALADALAGGRVSVSWARQLADWSDLLPADARGEADAILAAAAANGLDLAGVGRLAEEIRRRTATPDTDGPDDGFGDRALHLADDPGRGRAAVRGPDGALFGVPGRGAGFAGEEGRAGGHPDHRAAPPRRPRRSLPQTARLRLPARPGRAAGAPEPAADLGPVPERPGPALRPRPSRPRPRQLWHQPGRQRLGRPRRRRRRLRWRGGAGRPGAGLARRRDGGAGG